MNFRIGKTSDYKNLARIHYNSGKFQTDGFMYKLGFNFLKIYYKILLNEKETFVLVAEDNSSKIHGFVSGTQSASNHLKALKKSKFILGFSVIFQLIINLKLWIEIFERYKFIKNNKNAESFGVKEGSRLEYWIWDKDSSSNLSVILLKSWLEMMKNMGVSEIRGEVDKRNTKSQKVHELMGAIFYDQKRLNDGRERIFYKYSF